MAQSQFQGVCYSTLEGAEQALNAAETGRIVPVGSVVYSANVTLSGMGGCTGALEGGGTCQVQYKLSPITGSTTIVTSTKTVNFPACQLLTWDDGLTLGWGVAAAWLAAFAIMFVRRGLVGVR